MIQSLKRYGDWSYWRGNTFIKYTWRHRLRLLIGLHGKMQNGEYIFRGISYESRLYRFLNYFLCDKSKRYRYAKRL